MKNAAKKITAFGLGTCFLALWVVFLLFITKPYTESVIIWLPDNYKLENTVSNEVISMMPNPDATSYLSDKIFYSQVHIDSFNKLFGKSQVAVRIQAGYNPSNNWYMIVYQKELCCEGKSFIVTAQCVHDYNRRTFSEMKLRDKTLFLKHKRDTMGMITLSILGFVVIRLVVFSYTRDGNTRSKQKSN